MKIEATIHPEVVALVNRNLGALITADTGKGLALAIQEILQSVANQATQAGMEQAQKLADAQDPNKVTDVA